MVVVHKNVFKDCMKHVVMQSCHVEQWHDGVKHSGKAGMPHVENNTVQRLASLLDSDRRWTARELTAEI